MEMLEDTKKYIEAMNQKLQKTKTHVNQEVLEKKIAGKIHRRSLKNIVCFRLKKKFIKKANGNKITSYQINYMIDEFELNKKNRLDGLCVFISNDFDKEENNNEFQLKEKNVVENYRSKHVIEQSFRYIKSFLKIRPFFLRKTTRIKGHINICILAHFIDRYIINKLKTAGITDHLTFPALYRMLSKNSIGEISIKNLNINKLQLGTISDEQNKILIALNCHNLSSHKALAEIGVEN